MTSEIVAEQLRELEQAGRLIPSVIVETARDPDSPLHSHFEWDNTVAADRYRLLQARALIRTVKLEVTVRDVPLVVPYYVRDPEADAKQAGYRNITSIRTEDDIARAAIIDAMSRVSSAVKRAKAIAAYLGVERDVAEIETLARSITDRLTAPAPAPQQ